MHWCNKSSPSVKSSKLQYQNNMASIFWSRHDVYRLNSGLLPAQSILNHIMRVCNDLDVQIKTIMGCAEKWSLYASWQCLSSHGTKTDRIKILLKKFKWKVFNYPPYSPDLAPSDFHKFLYLKQHLLGKTLSTIIRSKLKFMNILYLTK